MIRSHTDMLESYPDFFRKIAGIPILPYQERYGLDPFSPALLIVPTGLGKTNAVLLPWLYAHAINDGSAPTRLIFVVPRQNLTTQTANHARTLVDRASLSVRVLELMGGSEENKDKVGPKEPAIIVATQDLYFSRALNRGYARPPSRWPVDFALYNQDCLIVLDEIQLMDDALATSAQLAAFRESFGIYGNAPCIWMSATVDPQWLRTVDFTNAVREIRLNDADYCTEIVNERVNAPKSLAKAPTSCNSPKGCAEFALSKHEPATRTLIVVNTIGRAREIFTAIQPNFPGAVLLHSRFRPADRRAAASHLESDMPQEGQVIVATQVLEAGVDITAKRLISDIAPWGSMVQRFGRVNRYGKETASHIWWVDAPTHSKQKDPVAPYSPKEIERSRERLATLTSASPADLERIPEDGPAPWQHVLRQADLIDLFDTTSDLSGNHIDVSRFIRATEDKDIYLAWREWTGESPSRDLKDLDDDELCPVPISEFREYCKKRELYVWNFATEKWTRVDADKLYAGMIVIARPASGGYTNQLGWAPDSKERVQEISSPGADPVEGHSDDNPSFRTRKQSLRAHTDRVVEELENLLCQTTIDAAIAADLRNAAAKHDWGKAHRVFQHTMHGEAPQTELLAKCEQRRRHCRPHFRHELASALAMLQAGDSALAAYLAAAHHGRIRLGIRSMPGETEENSPRARGIEEGDILPACELAAGLHVPEIKLTLAPMEFGAEGGSWTARMLPIRDRLGPFRLAYLEMLLRAADESASADAPLEASTCTN